MLRALKISPFQKTVFRCSISGVSGIAKTEDAGWKFVRDHKIPSFSGFRCITGMRRFSARSERLLPDLYVREKDDVTLDNDICDPPPGMLQDEENLLKVDNLELLKDIANGDNEVFELLKSIHVKLDIMACLYGVKLDVSREEWIEFLKCSPGKRRTYAAYLIVNTIREIKDRYDKPPPLFDLPEDDEEMTTHCDDVRCYHLFHNSMFLKLRIHAMRRKFYSRGLSAILYSSPIVIDCSYGQYMAGFEVKDLARQVNACAALNCKSEHPFHLMVCNIDQDERLRKLLEKFNPIICTAEYPLTITHKSYLDLFPKDKLVYLTPHCKTNLKNYDPDKAYIIGGFVDKTQKKPVSLAIAKEQEITMAKLPLDLYLDWGKGDKCLSLPHVLKIMHDLRTSGGNWHRALGSIPKRFLLKERVKLSKMSTESMASNMYDALDKFG